MNRRAADTANRVPSGAHRFVCSEAIGHVAAGMLFWLGILLYPAAARGQSNFHVLQFFNVPGPYGATGGLIQATDGNFYGTSSGGGQFDFGTIYRASPAGDVTVLYSFTGNSDGAIPGRGLIQASDGALYGAAEYGGNAAGLYGDGTLFRIGLDGTFTTLHIFTGGSDGSRCLSGLIEASDGNFYGTSSGGPSSPYGTVFRMAPDGAVTTIYAFLGGSGGADPDGPLLQASDGNIYGTTANGDAFNYSGTVFRLALDGTVTTLHSFTGARNGSTDGAGPGAGVIESIAGNFYGTTGGGGDFGSGTVFRLTPAGEETIIYSFTGGPDGAGPTARLLQSSDGGLYGMTQQGGLNGDGVIFRITSSGNFSVIHQFVDTEGFGTIAALVHAKDGNYYGTTVGHGGGSEGVIFRLDNPALCDDTLTVQYAFGTLNIGFTVRTPAPAFWGTWLVTSSGPTSLWQVGLPVIDPAVSSAISLPNFPRIGPVSVFSVLLGSMPGVICIDRAAVYSGP